MIWRSSFGRSSEGIRRTGGPGGTFIARAVETHSGEHRAGRFQCNRLTYVAIIYLRKVATMGKTEADRPAHATADEIEVTPEMIEAGLEEYKTRWGGLVDADEEAE